MAFFKKQILEPSDGRNNMTRAMWSPKVCLLERRMNRLALSGCRYDMYERAVTFEGHDFHFEPTPVRGSSLAGKVHEIADSIVQHVAAVTNDRINISHLALNLRLTTKTACTFVSLLRCAWVLCCCQLEVSARCHLRLT